MSPKCLNLDSNRNFLSRSCCGDWSSCQYRYHVLIRFRANKPYSGAPWQKEPEKLTDHRVYSITKICSGAQSWEPWSIVTLARAYKTTGLLGRVHQGALCRLNVWTPWWISIIIMEQGYKCNRSRNSRLCPTVQGIDVFHNGFEFTYRVMPSSSSLSEVLAQSGKEASALFGGSS